jgi:hypothetical protein
MYIDINTLFTFEMSKSDDQSILAAILLRVPSVNSLFIYLPSSSNIFCPEIML